MNSVKQHISIWLIVLTLQFLFFNYVLHTTPVVSHVAVFSINQIIAFYFNYIYLIPKLYNKNRYFTYIGILLLFVFVSSICVTFTEGLFTHENPINNPNHRFNIEPFLAHALPSIIALFSSFFIYSYQFKRQQEENEIQRLTAEKDFLIQQINPHFLFNALNNIYSLSLDHNPKGSEAILKLSSMLDYSLYKTSNAFNTLKQEIEYIQGYIELFKLKDEDIDNITFIYQNCNLDFEIAPLLLLPFIENALKHGNIEDLDEGTLDIIISTTDQHIQFTCKNTFKPNKPVDGTGGIGIANVSRRLELIYPNQHKLQISKQNNIYSVHLNINL